MNVASSLLTFHADVSKNECHRLTYKEQEWPYMNGEAGGCALALAFASTLAFALALAFVNGMYAKRKKSYECRWWKLCPSSNLAFA